MRNLVLAFCTIAALSLSVFLPAAKAATHDPGAIAAPTGSKKAALQAVQKGARDLQNGDFKSAAKVLDTVVNEPGFSLLNGLQQHAAWMILGTAKLQEGKSKEAITALSHSTASQWANGLDSYMLVIADWQVQDREAAIAPLTNIAERWPATLSQLSDYAILQIAETAQKVPEKRERALLEALGKAHWEPKDPSSNMDEMLAETARLRLKDGKIKEALTAIENLRAPRSIIRLRADKRFDAVVKANPDLFDLKTRVAKALDVAKARAKAAPDKLSPINAWARLLRAAGRPEEALDLLQKAAARAMPDDGSPSPFTDQARKFNWTLNLISLSQQMLGQQGKALATLQGATHIAEGGAVNISQTINLADFYNNLGQPKDALNTVAYLEPSQASPYGQMALADARACAYFQMGNKPALAKNLAYMKAHVADGWPNYLHTLLCTDNDDGVAELVIQELKSPSQRRATLEVLQDYRMPDHMTAREARHAAKLNTIKARPDVQAELRKVGRIEYYDILAPLY